jgi:mono/diheme cytochrome c family protein
MRFNLPLPRSLIVAAVLSVTLLAGTSPALPQDASSSASAPASASASAVETAAPTDEQIAAGLDVWKNRGGCFNCHGNFAQGGEGGHFPAGPSLRKSQLDPDTMKSVISCGLPGTQMPYNLKGAYTEVECYGNDLGSAPADVHPGAALSSEEIDNLLGYLDARVVGQRRITKAQCIEYYGDPNAPDCAAYH